MRNDARSRIRRAAVLVLKARQASQGVVVVRPALDRAYEELRLALEESRPSAVRCWMYGPRRMGPIEEWGPGWGWWRRLGMFVRGLRRKAFSRRGPPGAGEARRKAGNREKPKVL